MEKNNQIIEPQGKKSSNDFMKLFIGIILVIVAIVALKLLANAFGIL